MNIYEYHIFELQKYELDNAVMIFTMHVLSHEISNMQMSTRLLSIPVKQMLGKRNMGLLNASTKKKASKNTFACKKITYKLRIFLYHVICL